MSIKMYARLLHRHMSHWNAPLNAVLEKRKSEACESVWLKGLVAVAAWGGGCSGIGKERRGVRSVKIRSPAGAERQGDPCCSAGPGQADRRHGEGAAGIRGLVSQECFRKICCHTWGSRSFIWNAVLRTANDQLKLDYFFPFVSQPAAPAPLRICADGGRRRTKKVSHSFFSPRSLTRFLPLNLSHSLSDSLSAYPCRLSVLGLVPKLPPVSEDAGAFDIWQSRSCDIILGLCTVVVYEE